MLLSAERSSVELDASFRLPCLSIDVSDATAIVVSGCGLETVLPVSFDAFLGAAFAMSWASSSAQDGKVEIAKKERFLFNRAVEAYTRDGTLPSECGFNELSRRLTIIRTVCQGQNASKEWSTVSDLVETWVDRDIWEACVRTLPRDAEPSTSTGKGRASSGARAIVLARLMCSSGWHGLSQDGACCRGVG